MATILILDDSMELLEMLPIIFKMKGHKAITSSTKDSFLQKLQTCKPDLILIDIYLRHTDGREICKEIKGNEETKNIPVILISASPDKLTAYKDCDADGILEKPFDLNILITKIESLIYPAGVSSLDIF
jgi:DNA-binding response OmpR family regulator